MNEMVLFDAEIRLLVEKCCDGEWINIVINREAKMRVGGIMRWLNSHDNPACMIVSCQCAQCYRPLQFKYRGGGDV